MRIPTTIFFFFHSSSRTRGLQRAIEEQMVDPYFPVDMTEMAAHCNFFDMEEERVEFDDCIVQSMWLNHPQGCLGLPHGDRQRHFRLCHRQ